METSQDPFNSPSLLMILESNMKERSMPTTSSALSKHYTLEKDWDGTLYCRISLKWDCTQCHMDISMPVYVKELFAHFKHKPPTNP
jgi:hypothetical protein